MIVDWVAEFFGRHRAWVAAFVVAMTAAALLGLGRLRFDDVPRSVFRTNGDDFALLEKFYAEFDSDDTECLLVVEAPDLFAPDAAKALRKLATEARKIPGVTAVRSLADATVFRDGRLVSLLPGGDATAQQLADARRAALDTPLVRGQVLSDDARTALVIVRLDPRLAAIREIDPPIQALKRLEADPEITRAVNVRLTGVPPIRVEIFGAVQRETSRFILLSAALALVMAFVLFRQVWSVLIVASAPILGSIWTLGVLGLVGEPITVISTILPTLVMVIGFSDAMHVMMDIRHSLADGLSPIDASKSAIRHLGVAVLLTSSTTAVGFGSLVLADVEIIRRFGLACAGGSVLALLAVMTVIPLLASTWLGRHLHATHSQDFLSKHRAFVERWIDFILRHARPITIAGTALTLALAATMYWLVPDNRLLEMIPRENESYKALRLIDEKFGGTLTAFVLVEWPEGRELTDPEVLAALGEAENLLRDEPGVNNPLSVLDLLAILPGREGDLAARAKLLPLVPLDVRERYFRPESRRAVVVARLPDVGTTANKPVFERIERGLVALEQKHPDVRLRLTGTAVVGARSVHAMIESLNQSLFGAGIVIFGSIMIGFRSITLGAISILPNVFPLVATGSLLVFTGRPLQMASVMVFSVCLGIAVDDTIHFLNRFQRELRIDGDVPAAIRRAFLAVGSAVITTTIVLLTGFGSVMLSEMPSSRLFAWLSCSAYATAIMGDLVLLPALLVQFVRPPATVPAPAQEPEVGGLPLQAESEGA